MPSKSELRQTLLKQRRDLSPDLWQQKSKQICQHLQQHTLFQQARTVLAYFSVRQEPDLTGLFQTEKIWGLPRCVGPDLAWYQWSPTSPFPLQTGAFGIREPDPGSPPIDLDQVDLILLPAVGCDQQGYRLGYGGGFYDRLLSTPPWRTKPTIAVIFDFARLETLPVDPWDQPVDAVVTESGIWTQSSL